MIKKKEYPMISCKCITYGRIDTLEEAIYSFLIQNYPADKCELIIVNDYPKQNLIFDHPQVTIYNLDETFPLIGEKENYAIERCRGELIAVWDDDDIALNNHLQNVADHWKEDTNIIHWNTAVFYNEPEITKITCVGNSGIVYSKKVWEHVGKSPLENAGGDMILTNRIHALGGKKYVTMPDEQAAWFYMWSGRSYHQSGQGPDIPGKKNIIEKHSEHIENERKRGKIPTGDIHLEPKWNKDYAQLLKDYIKNN